MRSFENPLKQIQFCTFCGDRAVKLCKRTHRDWVIIEPHEIKTGDILTHHGRLYTVTTCTNSIANDCAYLTTGQGTRFSIQVLTLPILVKRTVVCGYPCCEFHCHKCMRFAEMEAIRDKLMGKGKTKAQSANAGKPVAVAHTREEHRPKQKKPPLERVMH